MTHRPNTLNLSSKELQGLVATLEHTSPADAKRQYARWPFPCTTVRLDLVQPSGARASLDLACRNLSCQGAGLLHSAYLHPGGRCTVRVPGQGGGEVTIPGVLVRCSHRGGMVHELGVRFDRLIDVRKIVPDPGTSPLSFEVVSPDALEGRVLLGLATASDAAVVRHLLGETRFSFSSARSSEELVELARGGARLLILGEGVAPSGALDVLRALRASGCQAPAILLSGDPKRGRLEGHEQLHALVLPSPPAQRHLLCAAAELLLMPKAPARATAATEVDSVLEAWASQVEAALERRDAAGLRTLCERVARLASSPAYATLRSLAEATAARVKLDDQLAGAVKCAREMLAECDRVQFKNAA